MSRRRQDSTDRRAPRSRRSAVIAAVAAVAAVTAAGCGGDGGAQGNTQASNAPKISTSGLPRALARNVEQANLIIDGSGDQLRKKLDALRGHPIVVNQWASWCTPCRREVPFFQSSARRHASEIAFLGLNSQDDKQNAREFLEELPMPYPSIFDPDTSYAAALGAGRSFPSTALVDEQGEVVFVHQGSYADLEQLEGEIERYLPKGKT